MPRILFIKTSSLGDVVHNMPAVTEVRRRFPDAQIAWVVEEPYAPLVALHPAVNEIVTVATRRWRRQWTHATAWREMRQARAELRARPAETVIDTQGLVRSALLAWFARGVRHGYDAASIREPLASRFYDVRHAVPKTLHAIERNRLLAAAALGYSIEGAIDYGLPPESASGRAPYAVVLHGSAQARKEWPEAHWASVAAALDAEGLKLVLASGSAEELRRSERLAAGRRSAELLHGQPLDVVARTIAGARLVVGLDTGLLHVAAAYATPLVGLFCGSDPALTGPRGAGPTSVLGGAAMSPDVDDVIGAARRLLR